MTLTKLSFFCEEITSLRNTQFACYLSVQIILPSCLLHKIVQIKTWRTTVVFHVSYKCETWSLTLRGVQE